MKKFFILFLAFFSIFLIPIIGINAEEQVTLTDNYRIYEPFNMSETKNIQIEGKVKLDFSNGNVNGNSITGLYGANYNILSKNNGNSNLKLGVTFNSNLENLKDFYVNLDGTDINYSLKFLNDKFKIPNGPNFYQEILTNLDSVTYNPSNFNKDDVGTLRKFNLQIEDSENVKYEITVKYSTEKSKVLFVGGEDITVDEDKTNRTLKMVHELSGKSKTPVLFTLGDDVNISTKVIKSNKELQKGFSEKIDKSSISVSEYFKEMFLSGVPENTRQKISDENLFEIFAEGFDKVLGGGGFDSLGILNSKSEKQIAVIFEVPLEPNKERHLNIGYPTTASLTTINESEVMKLNIEASPFNTFEKFKGIEYSIVGTEKYKYIINSNEKFKNYNDNSIITISKVPEDIINALLFKESYLKGISVKSASSYTNIFIILFGVIEIIGVMYLRNNYLGSTKKNKKRK